MEDGRAEGSSAIGDGGQAAISLTPDVDGTGSGSLMDSILSTLLKKPSSDVWVVALFFLSQMTCNTGLHSERLLQPSCTGLHSGPVRQKLTVPPQRKSPCHCLHGESLRFFSYLFFLFSLFVHSLGHQFHQVFISKLLMLHNKKFNEVVLLQI